MPQVSNSSWTMISVSFLFMLMILILSLNSMMMIFNSMKNNKYKMKKYYYSLILEL